MFSFSSSKSNSSLEAVLTSSAPPSPASGISLRAPSAPAAGSLPPTASVCAAYWAGAAEAETLHTSQVLSVAADELDWLYEHTDDETDPTCVLARAVIEARIAELSPEHQVVIALHHDPTPWPEELPGHEEDSFAVILHMLCPSTRRALRMNTPRELELRARRRVEICLDREGPCALRTLIRRARWAYEEALQAYAEVRGRAPSAVPAASASFVSSADEDALS